MACTDPFSIWLCLDDYTCQMILWSLPFRLPVTNDNKKKKDEYLYSKLLLKRLNYNDNISL